MTDSNTEVAADDPHLVVEGLVKRFGATTVLAGVDLRLDRGQIGVVIGGSGAGKTTLLKILIGLERATSGRILVAGEDIVPMGERDLNRVRRRFGMVFQYSALLDSMNVLDNVAFPLREHTRMSERDIRSKVAEKLEILGLAGIEQRFPSQLSGGMKKRVGLARALMLDPEFLMYDEPTSGLDPLAARVVDELIVDTRDRFGVTSVVISHDMAGALAVADRIFVLERGQLAVSGAPSELVRMEGTLANQFFEASGIAAERLVAGRRSRYPS